MLQKLPILQDFNNQKIIKKLIEEHKALANLKWTSKIIPNQDILINSLTLLEAKDSSEIENIITTHDELYISSIDKTYFSKETKEVQNYKEALLYCFNIVKNNKLLLLNDIIKTQEILEWNWEEWILYILEAIEKTSLETINKVNWIYKLMKDTKVEVKEKLPKIYSKDLIEILFSHPYTKIEFVVDYLIINRKTAWKYLDELVNIWILELIQIKNTKYFINIKLFNLLKKWYSYQLWVEKVKIYS